VTEDRLEAAEQTGDDERARTHGEDGLRRRLPGRGALALGGELAAVGALMAAACFLGAVA
jgi:hypothetical protein